MVFFASGTALATPFPVPNGDFETSNTTFVGGTGTAVANFNIGAGWLFHSNGSGRIASGVNDISMGAYTSLGNAQDVTAADGAGKAFLRFTGGSGSTGLRNGTITSPSLQLGGLLIAADTTYTLTVAVGNRNDTTFPFGAGTQNAIQLLANGAAQATQGIHNSFGNIPTDGTWADFVTSFTTDSSGVIVSGTGSAVGIGQNVLGQELRIRLVGQDNQGGGPKDIEFDTVRLDVTTTALPVAEPATFGVASLALVGLGVLLRRRNPLK